MNKQRVKIGGKFSFSKLPQETQEEIKKRLAEKSENLKRGFEGILPGIKIDGKVVTKDNIHEFERKTKSIPESEVKEEPKEKSEPIVEIKKKHKKGKGKKKA